jgi:predicted dehydrogenase
MTRFGVCGTAFWAENVHIPGLAANPDIQLVGVWGRSADRAAELAEASGIRAFATFDELVDAVDAVSFVVPPAVQAELAPRAIRKGRHALLEKPLGPTIEDARKIVRAVADNGVAALCFLTRMFVGEMSAFVERARATAPTSGEASFRSNALIEGPYASSAWRQGEHGALWDAAPHGMSVLVSVLGPVEEVSASLSPDGSYAIMFRHAAGSRSQLDLNLRDRSVKLAERYRFSGTETVELPGLAYDRKATFAHAAGLLLKEIGGERKESNSRLRLGLHLVAVAVAAQESLRSGGAFIPVASAAP